MAFDVFKFGEFAALFLYEGRQNVALSRERQSARMSEIKM